MTDVVENGITRRVVTVRLSKVITSLRITIGAYAEANDISCIFAKFLSSWERVVKHE